MHNMQRIILAFLLLLAIVTILMVTRRFRATPSVHGTTTIKLASLHAPYRLSRVFLSVACAPNKPEQQDAGKTVA